MKQEMMAIVSNMVAHGYNLFSETLEQFVDRMISCGYNTNIMKEWSANFMKAKGL